MLTYPDGSQHPVAKIEVAPALETHPQLVAVLLLFVFMRQQDATFLAGGQRLCDEGCPCPRGLGGTRGNRGLLGRDAVTVMKTGESQQNPDTMLILAFFLWETIWRQNE